MKNVNTKKNFFRIFLTFNIMVTIIIAIIIITFFYFFRSSVDIFDINNYSKLIISNISLKLDSIMKNYVNTSIFKGIPYGPIIKMEGNHIENKTKIQGLFYDIKAQEDTITVNYIYEGVHYTLIFDKKKLVEILLEQYNIDEEFFFTNQKGKFLAGSSSLFEEVNHERLSIRNELDQFKNKYLYFYEFDEYGISFFMKNSTVFQRLIMNNIHIFIILFLGIIILSIPMSLMLSSYFRKKLSKSSVSLIKGIADDDLDQVEESDIEEYRYYIREIKDIIKRKTENQESLEQSLGEMGYLYEIALRHNSVLVEIIGLIKEMLKYDFDETKLNKKLKSLERNKIIEKIDSEFYVVLKKDLLEINNYIKKFKSNKE
ncbi:MAG: hypothetical protein PWQ85_1051 [Geotoga sp.]|nr:hypothetical protein [Geotoga sp.]